MNEKQSRLKLTPEQIEEAFCSLDRQQQITFCARMFTLIGMLPSAEQEDPLKRTLAEISEEADREKMRTLEQNVYTKEPAP